MQAGQSLAAELTARRSRFNVLVTWKDGHQETFDDATAQPMDGWLVVSVFSGSDDWHRVKTIGFRGDAVLSYAVTLLE